MQAQTLLRVIPAAKRSARTGGAVHALGACLIVLVGCGQTQSGVDSSRAAGGADAAGDAAVHTGGSGGGGGAIASEAGVPSGGSSDAGAGGQSVIERPPPPPWQPYFDLGAPGWRDSTEPLCTERFGAMGQAVWSDEDAVFALVGAECNALAGIACGGQGMSLYRNDGTGWAHVRDFDTDFNGGIGGLSGFTGGDLIVYGGACGISLVSRDGSTSRCTSSDVANKVRTSGTEAYALAGNRVLQYDGVSAWNVLATLPVDPIFGATDLSVAGGSIIVAGRDQYVARGDSSGIFEALPGVPAGDYGSVWAFGPSDIWLGNFAGQVVHFDGAEWTIIDTGGMSALWGSPEGILYLRGRRDFGRWNGSAVERFAIDPGENGIYFSGMWGNHTNEVFLSVIDNSFRDYQCSGVFMLYFDGTELHRF